MWLSGGALVQHGKTPGFIVMLNKPKPKMPI